MRCPPGCVSPGPGMVPAGGVIQAIPDPCDRCTVTDSMADMMVATCPGRKRRAILEPALLGDHTQISPSPAISQSDHKSSKDNLIEEDREAKYYPYWITTTIRSTE